MTTSATQLLMRLRTWLLVAGLTGLVIALGAMIGGGFLWLFAALALIFNLVGYFYSDRIALRVAHAEPLSEHDAQEVHSVVRELAAHAHISTPRLYVMPGEQPNAFATGRNPQHAAIAATEGLLTTLPLNQIEGVLAHEIAHIKNRDILVSSIAAMIAGVVSAIANALEEIERSHAPALHVNPVTAPMYIANPLSGGQMGALFSTHPPISGRIRRLRTYDRQQSLTATAPRAPATAAS